MRPARPRHATLALIPAPRLPRRSPPPLPRPLAPGWGEGRRSTRAQRAVGPRAGRGPLTAVGAAALLTAVLGCAANTEGPGPESSVAAELAEALVATRSYDRAIALLREGIERQPDDGRLHRLLGVVLCDKGLYAQAKKELTRATTLNPTDADAYSALGVLAALQGDAAGAERHLQQAIQIGGRLAVYYNNLGFALYLQGRDPEAAAAYEEALRVDPASRRAYNNLGFARARAGDSRGAIKSFEQAAGPAGALANLGLARELGGDPTTAVDLYRQALALDPHLSAAKDGLLRLEELEPQPLPEVHDATRAP
ncbi:MAG: tetratricopeptide repeat protein [Deltaproteobacteria bacterium]|nr:tetratricopeptide repeat protein [Deltaproteobacteria bacterium]